MDSYHYDDDRDDDVYAMPGEIQSRCLASGRFYQIRSSLSTWCIGVPPVHLIKNQYLVE